MHKWPNGKYASDWHYALSASAVVIHYEEALYHLNQFIDDDDDDDDDSHACLEV